MSSVRNPFGEPAIGAIYAHGRPYHHPRALKRAAEILALAPATVGLDIACGTGLSTTALQPYARSVIGTDPAGTMLAAAPTQRAVDYVAATAEALPFQNQAADLITVSSGVHWFDQHAFFTEARRVLTPRAAMVIYDHFFVGQMDGVVEFGDWMGTYLGRYPGPARRDRAHEWSGPPDGFELVGEDNFGDPIPMTNDELIAYFLTQSGTLLAAETPEAKRAWLHEQTAPFFNGMRTRTLQFWATLSCYRRR